MPSNYFYKTTLFAGNCVSHAVKGQIGFQKDPSLEDSLHEALLTAKNSCLCFHRVGPNSLFEDSTIELFAETLVLSCLPHKISGYSLFFILTSRMDYFFFTIRHAKFTPLYYSTIQPLIPLKRQLIYVQGTNASAHQSFICILLNDIELKVFSYDVRGSGKDVAFTADKPWSLHIVNKKPVLDLAVVSHQFPPSDPNEYLTILHGGSSAGTGTGPGRFNDPKPYNLSTYKLNLTDKKFEMALDYSNSVFDMSEDGKHLTPDKLQRIFALKNTVAVFGQFSLRLFRGNCQHPIAYSTFMASDFNTIAPIPGTSNLLVACRELKTLYYFHIDDSSLVKPLTRSTLLGTTGITSAICPLSNGLVFLGSIIDNSCLVRVKQESSRNLENNPNIHILESYPNFGPITQLECKDQEFKGKQLLAVSPWRKEGQLMILSRSLRIDSLFRKPLKNIKMLHYLESFSALVLSTENITVFIKPNEGHFGFSVDKNVIRDQCLACLELHDSISLITKTHIVFVHPLKLATQKTISIAGQFSLKGIIKARTSKAGNIVLLDENGGLFLIRFLTKEGIGNCSKLGSFNAQSFLIDDSQNVIVVEWFKNSLSIIHAPSYTATETIEIGPNYGVCDMLSCSYTDSTFKLLFLAFNDGVLRVYSMKNEKLEKEGYNEFPIGYMPFQISLLEATHESITILAGNCSPQIITFYGQSQRTINITLQLENLICGSLIDMPSNPRVTDKKKSPKLVCYATQNEFIIGKYEREHRESISSKEVKKENKTIKKCAFLSPSSDTVVLFGDYIPSKYLPNPMLQASLARNCCMFVSITEMTSGQDYAEELFLQTHSINMLTSEFDDRHLVICIGKQISSEIDELINNSQKYCIKFGTITDQSLSKHWDTMIVQEPISQIERFRPPSGLHKNMYTMLLGYGLFKFISVNKKVGLEDQLIIEELFSFNSHSYVRYFMPIQNTSNILVAEMHKALIVFQVNVQGKRMISVTKGAVDAGSSLSCAVLGKNKYLSIDDKGNLSVYLQETSGKNDRNFYTLSNLGKICLNSRCYSILKTKGSSDHSLLHSTHLQKYLGQGQDAVLMASVKGEIFSFQSMNEKLYMNLSALQAKIIDHMQKNHPLYANIGKMKVGTIIKSNELQNVIDRRFFNHLFEQSVETKEKIIREMPVRLGMSLDELQFILEKLDQA